jgi:hypothetical protein
MPRARDIEDYEKLYHPSKLSCFRKCVGPEGLERITETILDRRRLQILRDLWKTHGKILWEK